MLVNRSRARWVRGEGTRRRARLPTRRGLKLIDPSSRLPSLPARGRAKQTMTGQGAGTAVRSAGRLAGSTTFPSSSWTAGARFHCTV